MAQGGALIQSEDQEENTHQGRGGGGLEPACCTKLDRLHLFEAQAPALPFAFPLWPGLLRSPPYHHHHRSLLPCHRAPPGPRAKGRGTWAATRLHKQPVPELGPVQQNWEQSLPSDGCRSSACPAGQAAGSGGAPALPGQETARSGSGQVTALLDAGNGFRESKMRSAEAAPSQRCLPHPVWAEQQLGGHSGWEGSGWPGALRGCQAGDNTKTTQSLSSGASSKVPVLLPGTDSREKPLSLPRCISTSGKACAATPFPQGKQQVCPPRHRRCPYAHSP